MKNDIVLSVENAIKQYRKYAQKKIRMINEDLTLDQAYILTMLLENPDITQMQVADTLHKDNASLSRMIDSLVDKEYLSRVKHKTDRRRSDLKITRKGQKSLAFIGPAIAYNQQQAFKGISQAEAEELDRVLTKIAVNCDEML
jgi:DNA-binding MarR family transcriptional regulator